MAVAFRSRSLPERDSPTLTLVAQPASARRMSRKDRRAARPRQHKYVEHACDIGGCKSSGFAITICLLHDYLMTPLGEYGRKYPAPVCYECLPGHEIFCPLGNPAALVSWLHAGNPMTCICPSRLSLLGLSIQRCRCDDCRKGGQRYGVIGVHAGQ